MFIYIYIKKKVESKVKIIFYLFRQILALLVQFFFSENNGDEGIKKIKKNKYFFSLSLLLLLYF